MHNLKFVLDSASFGDALSVDFDDVDVLENLILENLNLRTPQINAIHKLVFCLDAPYMIDGNLRQVVFSDACGDVADRLDNFVAYHHNINKGTAHAVGRYLREHVCHE